MMKREGSPVGVRKTYWPFLVSWWPLKERGQREVGRKRAGDGEGTM